MSSRRSTFLPSLAALGALCCQPVLEPEVPGSPPYLISEETPQGAAIVLGPGRRARRFREAPMLARLVARGKLPPVEERLPENPLVLDPIEPIGRYGGTVQSGMIAQGLNEEMNRIMGNWESVMVRPEQEVLCLRRERGEPSETRKNCPKTDKVYRNRTLRPATGHFAPMEKEIRD